ncbi:flavin reductase [Micrococcus flavus]|uniref:Flavin reductase (DIM6/NTAB) family NADH-FMN oxidoreductase RutF n=1 Tax=Micrococcus flavus TaxID=384602 RepID=A0A4Y8X2C4_9MICC|nr:flavin reductase family protein [Micrococcus flavus]MBB4881931.1 flavin reductase (DIM6/NTAB) family NADH-FMN oxidoreductase RutF [Micrococcus flavus]TFI03535.1 flavin reductase [Micrococcus flavus]
MTATLTRIPGAVWNTDVSKDSLRSGLAVFPTGVVAVSGHVDGHPEVMVSSSFGVGISWEPALVSFSAQNTSRTWPRLRRAETIGISLLAEDQAHLCRQLASRDGDRFAGVDVHASPAGAPLLEGSSLWLETRLHAEVPAGDHTVVLLEVTGFADHTDDFPPATLHRNLFHGLRGL